MLSTRKFRTLNHLTLGDEIGYCMGVKKGNNVLYSILSRVISLTDKSVLNNAMYEYIDSTREYSIIDFVLDHTLLVISVILIITGLIVAVGRVHHQANIDILTGLGKKFNLLDWELNEINQKEHPYVVPLSVSKVAAAYIPDTDTCFEDVFNRADQMMYEDKRAYYEKHGDRRR